MTEEFLYPDFIEDNDAESIHERMMSNLPPDISSMPGDFAYDFTMPSAIEKSELIQFYIVRILMLMFPMWAWDDYLDYHARAVNLSRKEAVSARGYITITGEVGTHIDAGSLFAVPGTDDNTNIDFRVLENIDIPDSGSVNVEIEAVDPGANSNVLAHTIVIMHSPVKGIISIDNEAAVTGGTDEEDDDSFRERILEAYRFEESYCGNDADYVRWAKAVPGVGSAIVEAEWDGPSTVKLIVTDSNGFPANEYIREKVYDYIIRPDDRMNRLAPIGAILTVTAPDVITIDYDCIIELESGYDLDTVNENFRKLLSVYYDTAIIDDKEIRLTKVGALLSATEGVRDYAELLVNGGTKNIPVSREQFPVTGTIHFRSGVVE